MNGGTGACAGTGDCVNFQDGVTAQDLIVCGAWQADPTAGGGCTGPVPNWTFTDTLSNTFTDKSSAHPGDYVQLAYQCVGSTNATYRVNRTGNTNCSSNMVCTRFINACSGGAITVDVFQSNTFSVSGTGITTLTNTLTTTKLNDLIVSIALQAPLNGGSNRISPTGALNFAAGDSTGSPNMAWAIAPTLGSNSFTWSETNAIFNSDAAQTVAFAIPIRIGNSDLPEAVNGSAYSAQLYCYGGTSATPSFALASGAVPTGLTLHTATGVIDGTATVNGTTAATYTCTDGTSTSSAVSLPMTVGAGGSITKVTTFDGNFNGGGGSIIPTQAVCGDILTLVRSGADTHGGVGYLMGIHGTNNSITSSDGAPVKKCFVNAGLWVAPLEEDIIGPFVGSSPTITVTNGTSASAGLGYFATLLRGAQAICEKPAASSVAISTTSTSATTNYTTAVANEYLQMSGISTDQSSVWSFNTPLTLDLSNAGTFIPEAFGHAPISTASTVTATVNDTTTAGICGSFTNCAYLTALTVAVRPGFDNACAQFAGSGEKHRRTGGN